jgi:predicted phosphodiesterase
VIAFISDLHSNLEALDAALRDIEALRPSAVICLGDIVGYGANPREVILRTREVCQVVLQGNHDAALLDDRDAAGFNERALRAIDWTRAQMDAEREENWPLWDWLGGLLPSLELSPEGGEALHLVHASPRHPLAEYLMPNFGPQHERVAGSFAAARRRLTFYGHTHHPGWFAEGDPFARAVDNEATLRVEPGRRYLINVGSIGQPRDGDPRLGYALFDGEVVRCRRILDAGLPASLAERLLVGR